MNIAPLQGTDAVNHFEQISMSRPFVVFDEGEQSRAEERRGNVSKQDCGSLIRRGCLPTKSSSVLAVVAPQADVNW